MPSIKSSNNFPTSKLLIKMKKDQKIAAYFLTTLIVLCFTVVPFVGDIYRNLSGDPAPLQSVSLETLEKATGERYDMPDAVKVVYNVDEFQHTQNADGTYSEKLLGYEVETDLSENDMAELFYTKEEIVVRIADNGRISIIAGDNGQF